MDRQDALRYVALAVSLIAVGFPLYWVISTSIKPPNQWLATPPVFFTTEPTLVSYEALLIGFGQGGGSGITASVSSAVPALITSVIIATVATTLSVASGTLAAYSISRFQVGGNSLPVFLLTPRMFPPMAVVVPLLIMYTTLGLLDTIPGMIIAYTGFTIPFSVWMVKSFIDEIPEELEEAAMLDGMTRFESFLRVTLPLISSGVAATFLFIFILNWSEFLIALTLLRNSSTAPIYMSELFSASAGELFGLQAALGVISAAPMVIFGWLIYEQLARGFTFGAIHK
jgi:multiple sugar transport system permease protein